MLHCHALLNFFKIEIESSGELVHNASQKVILCLIFFQTSMALYMLGLRKYYVLILIVLILVGSVFVYFLYSDKFLNADIFADSELGLSVKDMKLWYQHYNHPMIVKMV